MARELKVYGTTLIKESRFDPRSITGRQVRAIVAATTQKRAAELMGVTSAYLREWGSTTGNAIECEIALAKPETLFVAPIDRRSRKEDYAESQRKPHVPMRRTPRVPYVARPSPPFFSREEYETIRDRFSMSNDPLGQGIHDRVAKYLDSLPDAS